MVDLSAYTSEIVFVICNFVRFQVENDAFPG